MVLPFYLFFYAKVETDELCLERMYMKEKSVPTRKIQIFIFSFW